MNKLEEKYFSNYFLTSFDFLKEDKVFASFLDLLKTLINSSDFEENIKSYSIFLSNLYKKGYKDFSKYVLDLINKTSFNKVFEYDINREITVVNDIVSTNYNEIIEILSQKFPEKSDFISKLLNYETQNSINIDILEKIKNNENVFEKNRAFIFDNDFSIKPVKIIEDIKFSDLKGYVEQKKILYDNTLAFLKGQKVNNVLLYGDAGCGKSSSIRALLNEFEGLKIVQIFKNNLINLDKLYKILENLPYKFIIFADDISFNDSDENFSTMKAILEGSLIQCPKNAVIYATSNRKHLVKESFQARMGDEIHLKDTINEITSLSERFGINLLFQKPTQKEYLDIVSQIANDNNIEVSEALIDKAKKFALKKGSNAPRIARQLIDNILANIDF